MLIMTFGFWFYGIAAVLLRARCIMLERERTSDWADNTPGARLELGDTSRISSPWRLRPVCMGSYGVTFALIFAELVLLARRRRNAVDAFDEAATQSALP